MRVVEATWDPGTDRPGPHVLTARTTRHETQADRSLTVFVRIDDRPGRLARLLDNCEMLDLATGGYYPATTHRVVNPTGEAATRPRMSLPLFLHPADDVVLAEGRTAVEFLMQRIAELRSQG